MTDDIRPGDMVQLKSDGPGVPVARIENEHGILRARCSWLDRKKEQTRTFPIALLIHTD